MIDAVLSVHTNPLTSGVAKFSQQLAQRLGVPFGSLDESGRYRHPAFSMKWAELEDWIDRRTFLWPGRFGYSVLWHDRHPKQAALNHHATQVWYADDLGCPSLLTGHALRRGRIHVLTFGMAHKRVLPAYERLRDLLQATGWHYTVGVSSAIHEGSPWDETWQTSDAAMRAIFGDRLRQYGFLADDGLVNAIQDADVVALFYDPAVRRNNTTLWAALEQSALVITNLDADSPPELQHGVQVYDIAQLSEWPDQASQHRTMRWAGRHLVTGRYSWDYLIAQLTAGVPA